MQLDLKPTIKVKYGADLSKMFVGLEIVSNYNITVDESVLSLWSGFMPTSSYPENSREFAGRIGFPQIFLPYGFLMNLALTLCAESYSSSSISTIEIRNVLYLAPAFPGDTFSCSVTIKEIEQDEFHNFVTATHLLSNQKGEAVFTLDSLMQFPAFKPKVNMVPIRTPKLISNQFADKILSRARGIHIENKIDDFSEQDVILHPYVRPVGKSENLFWATYLKDTVPDHYNYQRFNAREIIISDGIVFSMVLGIAGREFRQVLLSEIIRSFSVAAVIAEDRLGAFSYVSDVKRVVPGFEEIYITTFGLRNVDTETELHDYTFPSYIFSSIRSAVDAETVIKNCCPALLGKICSVSFWKVLRKCDR